MIAQKKIEAAEATRILALPEGHFLDFKAAAISSAKLSETISAFCNAEGGELFVGIPEMPDKTTHYWDGFESMEAANGLFQVIDKMAPLVDHYSATWLQCNDFPGFILQLIVPKTRGKLRALESFPGTSPLTMFCVNSLRAIQR